MPKYSGVQFLSINSPAARQFVSPELAGRTREVMSDLERVWPAFLSKHEEARRNTEFIKGEQWDYYEKIHLEKQGLIPFVFDQIVPKFNHVRGVQQATRLDSTLVAQNPEDEPAAATLNKLLKWHELANDLNTVKDEVFSDAYVKYAGATVMWWDLSEIPGGYCRIKRIPIYQLLWDTNTFSPDLSDCRFMMRISPQRKADLMEIMPEFAEEIALASSAPGGLYGGHFYDILTPRQREESAPSAWGSPGRDYIELIEHYERFREQKYVVMDDVIGKRDEFDEYMEAMRYALGLKQKYEEEGIMLITPEAQELVQMARVWKDCMLQSILIGGQCVSMEKINMPFFPYQICFGEFNDGDFWAPMNALIDPQIFLNRMMSEYNNQIGRSNKQFKLLNPGRLAEGYTIEDFRRDSSRTAAVALVDGDPSTAVYFAPNQQASPELMNSVQFAVQHMMTTVGGMNALGLQENAAESGKAVQKRQEAAGTARLPLFNHFAIFTRTVTESFAWYIKNYMIPQDALRIIGTSPEAKYITLMPEEVISIRDIETDVYITTSPDSDSVKETQFMQVAQMTSSGALRPETGAEFMFELSALDPDLKRKIQERDAVISKVQELLAEEQRRTKMEMEARNNVERSMYQDQYRASIPGQQAGERENAS